MSMSVSVLAPMLVPVWHVKGLLTKKECHAFVNLSDIIATEPVYFCEGLYRGMFTCATLAEILSYKIRELDIIEGHFIINDHFRLSKYEPNSILKIHKDRPNYADGYTSLYTINIFLNTIRHGGTSFWSPTTSNVKVKHRITYDAVAGDSCIFNINELHRGEPSNDVRYLLRTDIMVREA